MAITKIKNPTNFQNADEIISNASIQVLCPVCKATKSLDVPKSIVNQAKQLTTISISSGLVCKHHFQAFVDKNFAVRGYQKVDFEFKDDTAKNSPPKKASPKNRDKELLSAITMEGNFLEYKPKERKIDTTYNHKHLENLLKLRKNETNYPENRPSKPITEETKIERGKIKTQKFNNNQKVVFKSADNAIKNVKPRNKKMTLKEIYEEFWEFIENDNDEFQDFIAKDKRRMERVINQLI